MKIVVSSDWHIDHVTHGVSRFEELRALVDIVIDRAIAEGADAFFFLGDLCDPDSGSSVFRCIEVAVSAAERLNARDIPSIWLAGNHDVIEDGTGDTTLAPLRAVGGMTYVAERPCCMIFNDKVRIACFPFTATSHAYDAEAFAKTLNDPDPAMDEPFTGTTISIGHLTVPGVVPGEETLEMPRGREVVLPVDFLRSVSKLVLNGHYHRQQRTLSGVWIPGSLARLTFCEETHEPGFLVLNV